MIRRINRKWLLSSITIGLLALMYWYFTPGNQQGNPGFMLPAVEVAQVLEEEVQQWNEFSGRLVPIEQVEIRARVSGMIESVHFNNGSMVRKGDLLFVIDPRPYQAAVAQAEGALAAVQAQAKHAESELNRAEQLIKDKVISVSDYESRQNTYRTIQAQVKSHEASLAAAKLNLDFTQVTSPINGRISRAEITSGNLIEAGPFGVILATVVSNHPIYADFEIDEKTFTKYVQIQNKLFKTRKKVPVMMTLISDDPHPHQGFIESFDNRLNTTSGTIRARAVFNNPDHSLIPGLFVRVKLGDPAKTRAILITDKAIGTDQDKKFVLVVDQNNKVQYRQVQLGANVNKLRIIEQGLNANEKIVINGLQRIRPGMDVKPELVAMIDNRSLVKEHT